MSLSWSSLPLLPLRCLLDHLSTEDALAAMSTCRHWRDALPMFEGYKETLTLQATQMKKTLFLTRHFKRYTRRLHIHLDGNDDQIEELMIRVFPQYFDTVELRELIFIGRSYSLQHYHVPSTKLKRILAESLLFKNIHCIETFSLLGCNLDVADVEDKLIHKNVEYYSRGLLFSQNNIMSVVNLNISDLSSNMRHIIIDTYQANTGVLRTLWVLRQLRYVTLNITKKRSPLPQIDWQEVQRMFVKPLELIINIIAVPESRFDTIIDTVLVRGLNLISLKVLFCKSLYHSLLIHVIRFYQDTLREVVWADCPDDSNDPCNRMVKPIDFTFEEDPFTHMNPLVILCWKCKHLRRLAIHGYWMWHYDILGFVRLRKTLTQLEISSIYSKERRFDKFLQRSDERPIRVMVGDRPTQLDADAIEDVNEYTKFKWQPIDRTSLHPGLRDRASTADRLDYIIKESTQPMDITLY